MAAFPSRSQQHQGRGRPEHAAELHVAMLHSAARQGLGTLVENHTLDWGSSLHPVTHDDGGP